MWPRVPSETRVVGALRAEDFLVIYQRREVDSGPTVSPAVLSPIPVCTTPKNHHKNQETSPVYADPRKPRPNRSRSAMTDTTPHEHTRMTAYNTPFPFPGGMTAAPTGTPSILQPQPDPGTSRSSFSLAAFPTPSPRPETPKLRLGSEENAPVLRSSSTSPDPTCPAFASTPTKTNPHPDPSPLTSTKTNSDTPL